ncbi:hypothetical protein B0H10DRAFT_1633055, partial [Mycena sp. CBHHK59/15]
RCSWRGSDNSTFITKLHWCKDNGFQLENGWKPQTWAHCMDILKDILGPPKTGEKCLDHWGNLKSSLIEVDTLSHVSGFGLDDGLKMVTATGEVWDTPLQKHPKAKCSQKTPFPLYDDILYIVKGIVLPAQGPSMLAEHP